MHHQDAQPNTIIVHPRGSGVAWSRRAAATCWRSMMAAAIYYCTPNNAWASKGEPCLHTTRSMPCAEGTQRCRKNISLYQHVHAPGLSVNLKTPPCCVKCVVHAHMAPTPVHTLFLLTSQHTYIHTYVPVGLDSTVKRGSCALLIHSPPRPHEQSHQHQHQDQHQHQHRHWHLYVSRRSNT